MFYKRNIQPHNDLYTRTDGHLDRLMCLNQLVAESQL